MTRADWRDDALCAHVSPEIFFPPKGGSSKEAKRICALCPVKEPCLEFALEQDAWDRQGIYGGLSGTERAALGRSEPLYCSKGHRRIDKNLEPNGRCRVCHVEANAVSFQRRKDRKHEAL